jgi:hypothetical protein
VRREGPRPDELTLVVEDATATWNEDMQRSAIELMRERGVTIVCTDAVLVPE